MSSEEQIAREMLDQPGDTLVVKTERAPETLKRPDADRTFSKEAVEGVATKTQQWILSRLYRKWLHHQIASKTMEVTITVKLDGDPIDVVSQPVRLVFDGENRWNIGRSHGDH